MKEARSELVRVDESGVAHPIGPVASQRMRARQGAYRILPGPNHVVFMRYTGEDGERADSDGAIVRLAGEITAPGVMCDVMAMVAQTGWRGELVVMQGEVSRSLYFEAGNVVGARTTEPDERLVEGLYRFGAITKEQHALLLKQVSGGARSGSAAVDLGYLTRDQVYKYLGRQISEVAYAALTVGDGTFFFLDGFDDSRLVTRHQLAASNLLMEVVTRMDEMRYFEEKIPSVDYIPQRLQARGEVPQEYRATYELVDGQRSVEEIGRLTGRGEFATTKDIYALIQSKLLSISPPRVEGGLEALVATANEVLRYVHRRADGAERGDELRSALCSFATGTGVYEMLFRGAGPSPGGTFEAEVIAANVALVSHGSDPRAILGQMLHDYVGFAVFTCGNMLGTEAEAEIVRDTGGLIAALQV